MTSFFYVVYIAFHTSVYAPKLPLVHPKREHNLWCHYSVCLTRSRRVCYITNAVHELPSPLVHLLYWQTRITILNFHSLMNFHGFHPFTTKKRMTERCSSLLHFARGAAIFTLLLRHRVAFLHRTATCRPLFKPWVLLLSTYKTIELCLEFLSRFSGFHLTLPRIFKRIYSLHYFKKHKIRCEGSILCVCVPPFKFRTVYRCSWNLVWTLCEWNQSSTSHFFLP